MVAVLVEGVLAWENIFGKTLPQVNSGILTIFPLARRFPSTDPG